MVRCLVSPLFRADISTCGRLNWQQFSARSSSPPPSAAVLAGASSAFACGSNGYSYAGLQARHRALGISATVTPVNEFDVLHGHVAGWVGVSGPDAANGWLQVGLSSFPGVIGSDVYYEVALPGRHPVYHQVASSFPAGKAVEVSVLELRNRPDRWRVLLDGRPVSRPIRLPGSHVGWTPIATAERAGTAVPAARATTFSIASGTSRSHTRPAATGARSRAPTRSRVP